ncbi:type VI secretion system Vgr family protein [Hymenobacter crusticola]|uniref:Gp5/Type VI secretion system Vgr protein OB-fold domain-containing protein n=1 Tax=Hymenobacter crusticola TaxID=1770526 RepID=A0A243WGC2_9BACT|nr:phage baseplate assembly protein V [Hymenobacter crusticola]OUJ74793.1 hypothetical protein BXP70_08540 [Hymenobacter crusticola]
MPSYANHKTTISIEGTTLTTFQTLSISQSIHTQHQFEVAFEYEQVEASFTFKSSAIQELAGKNISIKIESIDSATAKLTFNGVITEAELVQHDQAFLGSMIVRGYGLPYKLATVPGISLYTEMSVKDLVTNCLSAYSSPKEVSAPLGPSHVIPYAVRYRETYWNFLRRLAYDYGAWFYYDGVKLHFTTTPGGTPVPLTFGLDMSNLRSGTRTAPQFVSHYDYFSADDTEAAAQGTANASLFVAPAENAQLGYRRSLAAADVKQFASNRSASFGADSSYVAGDSEVPGISVGTTVRISDQRSGAPLGDFNVIEVTHHIDKAQRYRNHFQAIPATVKVMPPGPLERPVCAPQLGKVMDNKDPKKLGRVQVQLQWMKTSEKTPWLRVLAPHYGLDAKQEKSRGFLFVPEVEDQVMVGFQNGDPERPFVFGAMPHGKNAAVADPAKEHHLSVSSGTTITFLDTQTKHELHLQVDDKNLITIVVDNGQGTITLNASKSLVLKATQEITLDAPKIAITGDNVTIKGTAKTAISGAAVEVKADAELKASAATVKVAGTGMATLESSGITTVKGSVVMIN